MVIDKEKFLEGKIESVSDDSSKMKSELDSIVNCCTAQEQMAREIEDAVDGAREAIRQHIGRLQQLVGALGTPSTSREQSPEDDLKEVASSLSSTTDRCVSKLNEALLVGVKVEAEHVLLCTWAVRPVDDLAETVQTGQAALGHEAAMSSVRELADDVASSYL